MTNEKGAQLRRDIGFFGAAFLVLNAMIGAGIFALPGKVAVNAGMLSPWLFLAVGVVFLAVVLTFAELASYFRESGGPVLYATYAFGPLAGFGTGWMLFLSRMTAFAANANVMAIYLGSLFPWFGHGAGRAAVISVVTLGLTYANILGVKDGVRTMGFFTVLKVLVYVFGIDLLASTDASRWLTWVAAFTIIAASIVALTKDNLKALLAYSTIRQISYIVLGGALATSAGVLGGGMHIAMHAVGKITLFFCAGAILVGAHKTEISEMGGLGRKMPFTFGAFLLGSMSVIGLPPMGGSWSKWYLMLGTVDAGQLTMMVVLMASSLLSIAYLMPVVVRGFFQPRPADAPPDHDGEASSKLHEAPLLCVVPPVLTGIGCVLLFFFADEIYRLLTGIVTP